MCESVCVRVCVGVLECVGVGVGVCLCMFPDVYVYARQPRFGGGGGVYPEKSLVCVPVSLCTGVPVRLWVCVSVYLCIWCQKSSISLPKILSLSNRDQYMSAI